MAQIKSKKDAEFFLDTFETVSSRDEVGNKRYFVLADRERGGQWTLMLYPDGTWTVHGKGESYCDPEETPLSRREACDFVWKHRSAVNKSMLVTA